MNDALRRAALAVSAAEESGRIYDRLATELSDILGMAIAFVAVFADPGRTQMRMLAFCLDGRMRAPFTYPLEGSPCAGVVGDQFRSVASGARREFPHNDLLAKLGLESYAAYPLNDAAGVPLGLIGAMDRKPLRDGSLCEAILKIFAMRAAAELEHGARTDADEALRASERRYRAIFNAAADSMVLRDAEFRVVDVNPAYEQMSGRPRAEALGRNDLTMSPPELTENVRRLHARALAGERVMFEALARRKDGSRFDIETRGVPIEHEGRPHVLYIGRDITARKGAERLLRSSEEQYRAIFNASTDALVLRDAEFRIVDVNPGYEALSGYARAEVLGRVGLTMRVARADDLPMEVHRRALAGEVVRLESDAMRKDGTRFHLEVSAVPMTYAGRPHVLYVGRDISERKRSEQRLRASEEQYRAIFNAAADALVLRDAEFRIVDVNPAYVSLSGFSRDEVIGKQHVVANPPETEARIRALHAKALAGEPVVLETVRISKDSTRRDVELRGVPILHRGEPHVLYVGRDISERKRNEERLRASEEQYRSIFNAATDALVLRDDQARVVDVNPAFLEMSGFTREEVIAGQRWFFAGPEQAALAKEMHSRVIAGESVDFEVQGVRKDGTPLEVEMRAVPILYRGRPHALGMARDITEKKRAEAERAQLEAQLRQAQRMEAIGHLTGGIAHDFNNLLASIMGYIVLASERESAAGDPKLGSYLDQALASSRGARDLIQQMLTFSRGQRGAPRALDLGAAVGESLKLLRSTLPSTLEIKNQIEATPAVMLDPVQLDQVLLNLSINARDAMAGSGRVAISVHPQTLQAAVCSSCRKRFAGEYVELAVADSGPGIPPAVLERMFEPFFTTKEVGRGAGMGLATVHGIVHEHGGHVVVETAPGAGTRFRLLWPMASGKALPSTRLERKSRQVKTPLKGRVLVVDDEPAVGGFMRELLESWGLEAASVTSPALAREAFERYGLVITDHTMPGTTGFELAREMIARRPGLPVILYTGHGERITQRDVEAAGIRALLHKPVEPDLLYEMLKSELP
jgi:PAS domain S-box-containing protein